MRELLSSAGVLDSFQALSDASGVSVAVLVREALQDFSEVSIAARLEVIQERRSKVVSIAMGR